MNKSERIYAIRFVQITSLLFLTLYVFNTYEIYVANIVWFVISVALGVLGYYRQLPVVLVTALFFMIGYGSIVSFKLYISQEINDVNWNDMIWIFIFPFFAIIGGLNREERLPRLKGLPPQSAIHAEEEDVSLSNNGIMLDESNGFVHTTSPELIDILEALVVDGLENKYTFSLLFVEVNKFQQFQLEYGNEQAQYFLNRVAGLINEVMPELMHKSYLDKGIFVVMLSGLQSINLNTAMLRLDNKFESMLLSRSRNEGIIRVQLKYGSAEFPIHGMLASILIDKATKELHAGMNGVES